MSLLKKLMAARCEKCPLCAHARRHPGSLVGRAVAWHGKWCPFWKARQEVYGEGDRSVTGSWPGDRATPHS